MSDADFEVSDVVKFTRFTRAAITAIVRGYFPGAAVAIEEPVERITIKPPWWAFWRRTEHASANGIVAVTVVADQPKLSRIVDCEVELLESKPVGIELRVSFLQGEP